MLSLPACVGQSFLLPSVWVRGAALGINAETDLEGLQVGLEQSCAKSQTAWGKEHKVATHVGVKLCR